MAAREGVEYVTGVLTGEARVAGAPVSGDPPAVPPTSSGHQQSPSDAGATSPPQAGKRREHEEEPPDAKRTRRGFRCLLCNVEVPVKTWETHVQGRKHCNLQNPLSEDEKRALGLARRRERKLAELRANQAKLLYVKTGKWAEYDPDMVEEVQREVVKAAGIKESAARELQRTLVAWLAEVVPIDDERFYHASTELTELVAGVALVHVSRGLARAVRHPPRATNPNPSTLYDGCDLGMDCTAHIAAFAQLAPRATNLCPAALSIAPDSQLHPFDPLLWLAACRFLFSKLPQMASPPQRLYFHFLEDYLQPHFASGIILSLLVQLELHTLLKSVQVHVRRGVQEEDIYGTVPPTKWAEITRKTVTDIRTAILLGVYRSKTSPLRILSPAVVPTILTHIRACSFIIHTYSAMAIECGDGSEHYDGSERSGIVWDWYE